MAGRNNLNELTDLAQLDADDITIIGEKLGKELANRFSGIKTNQVRNVYSAIISLRTKLKKPDANMEDIKRDLMLIKPKLAYAAGKQRRVKPLYDLLSQAIDLAKNSERQKESVENFITLVESIVAYHKFHGGE
ncbi:MAG: type III-A CRISPR-associated protein Csm2 [Ignavibacteriaceae bacterium]|nr:type III-A CRISPR-associated protein Csm2 [Ignavibacteriaceae bacterium]